MQQTSNTLHVGGQKNHKRTIRQVCMLVATALWLLASVACSNIGAGQASSSQPTPTPLPTPIIPEKPTYVVQSGTIVRTLEFIGRASPLLEEELFFETAGLVSEVLVERVDWVEAGDMLVVLDVSDLESQLEQKQLSLLTAELNLAEAEQDLADNLIDAQVSLEKAQIQLIRAQNEGVDTSVLNAQVSLDQAIDQLEEAQAQYREVMDATRDGERNINNTRAAAAEAVKKAELNLLLEQISYDNTILASEQSVYDLRLTEMEVEAAERRIEQLERGIDPRMQLEIDQIQLEIEELEQEIADAHLVAPFAGQILSVLIDPGDQVSAYETVMLLADPDELEFTAELGTEELSEMALDQPALITLRNRPEDALSGVVRQLPYPYGGGTTDASDDDPAVHIAVTEDVDLALGELATVSIVLEEKENVLWLPPAAIRTFQGRDFCVVQLEGGQKRVDVLVGIVTEERVEIERGLEEGQTIVGE